MKSYLKLVHFHSRKCIWKCPENVCHLSRSQCVKLPTHHINQRCFIISLWRHQMETFSALLAICAGNSPVTGEFPPQRPLTWSCGVFFDLRLNKRLSKLSWGRWFKTPSRPLWRHTNDITAYSRIQCQSLINLNVGKQIPLKWSPSWSGQSSSK